MFVPLTAATRNLPNRRI
ncbi:unnamed protein product [Staurois parvus]|uniref:Uncharacterized protein n=1 Tax=Staurois parvus TaxID=386267 RepID=A0ABN9BFL9_9NEOB|nr:unnamed protein product [Staurois parvus]